MRVGTIPRVLKRQTVGNVQRRFTFTARTPVGYQHLLPRQCFRLNKQLVEGRMLTVRVVGGHGEFNVAGEIKAARAARAIDQGDPAHLHIVFRRNDDFRFSMDAVIATVKYGPVKGEINAIPFNLATHRMPGVGPDRTLIGFMNVAKGPLAIASLIRPPAGEFVSAPLAVTAAAVGNHQAIASVAEQQALGRGGMGSGEGASCRCNQISTGQGRIDLTGRVKVQRRQEWNALLQQRLKGTHPWIVVKTSLERIAMQEIGQRQKGHPLVVGHVRLNDHPTLKSQVPGLSLGLPAEIHRFIVTEITEQPHPGQFLQIPDSLFRRHIQSQQGGIWRNDQLFLQAALQAERRHTEGLVLIGLGQI